MQHGPIWHPPERPQPTYMRQFQEFAANRLGKDFSDYRSLHKFSIEEQACFWELLAEFVGVVWQHPYEQVMITGDEAMLGVQWFAGGKLNFAENLLEVSRKPCDLPLVVSHNESTNTGQRLSVAALKEQVAYLATVLKKAGVAPGDRVAAVVANCTEAVVGMLAVSSLGGVWASCSPDFGEAAVLDRFAQIKPKVLLATPRYIYAGKYFDVSEQISRVITGLESLSSVILIDQLELKDQGPPLSQHSEVIEWSTALKQGARENPDAKIDYVARTFSDPLYILFSSGTTGLPKCIVHGVGGTLLQHKKELLLHGNIGPSSCLMYYTTCGWMMWNWMVSALATGARLVVYDGAVHKPDLGALWKICEREQVSAFGVSPKYLQLCASNGYQPKSHFSLSNLETIFSTGAPLLSEQFDWVYENVKSDVHLASISGGTDIVSCFMLGNPELNVYRGEIQCLGLGMAVEAWDEYDRAVIGKKGELVCRKPFVSMPVGFWNDPDERRYRDAYFNHFRHQQVWRHGDFIEITDRASVLVYGRSDATLNPGGVRIGTAELYRYIEALDEVVDVIAIGTPFQGDVDIVVFVKLQPKRTCDAAFVARLNKHIRENLTPRHVPKYVFSVSEIPYTRSGKKLELAVTAAFEQREVKNISAIANPDTLAQYRQIGKELHHERTKTHSEP